MFEIVFEIAFEKHISECQTGYHPILQPLLVIHLFQLEKRFLNEGRRRSFPGLPRSRLMACCVV